MKIKNIILLSVLLSCGLACAAPTSYVYMCPRHITGTYPAGKTFSYKGNTWVFVSQKTIQADDFNTINTPMPYMGPNGSVTCKVNNSSANPELWVWSNLPSNCPQNVTEKPIQGTKGWLLTGCSN